MTKGPKAQTKDAAIPLNGYHGNGAAGELDDANTAFLPLEKNVNSYDVEAGEERHLWSRKIEYILTMMGYCVGLGNVWRFPYVCIRNGGGAFLIPFFICLVLCGMPLFFMEVAVGQFLSRGPLHIWSICPLFKGIGISMNMVSLILSWYYGMILAWTLVFAGNSVRSPLPWTQCGQSWNTEHCALSGDRFGKTGNVTLESFNATVNGSMIISAYNSTGILGDNATWGSNDTRPLSSASKEFFIRYVLELSPGLEHLDGMPWHTVTALTISSVIVLACIIKGVHSVGKVVYVTATLPYILLTVFIIKGATLPGAVDGVLFYISPDFSKLLLLQTWLEASLQVFYSLGPAWGGLITMASYNKFDNNCMRDAIFLSFVCEGTSVFAGFAIFTVLGHMAYSLSVPVSTFSSTGAGLAFVVYPEAISYLPLPQLWGVLFFLMLFTVGLDSQFTVIETVLTTITDVWPKVINKWNIPFKIVYASILFLLSLPFATRGGMYLFQIADWYVAAFTICMNAILECIIIGWIYGAERFLDDIQMMIGQRPPYLFAILWRFVSPLILTAVLVSTLMTYEPPTFEGYTFGTLGLFLGWTIGLSSFVPVPAYAIYCLAKGQGSFGQRLKAALRPSTEWSPAKGKLREKYLAGSSKHKICAFPLPCTRPQN